MPRPFRAPGLAWLALVTFLLAQPELVCVLQCLDSHHGHQEAGAMATGAVPCHTHVGPAIDHGVAQTLSCMEPAPQPVPLRLAAVSVAVPAWRPTVPTHVSPSLDPPPPRHV